MTHLSISEERSDDPIVLKAVGEIDLASAPELETQLTSGLAAGSVVVNLTEVTFIDSTGLRVLLAAHEQATEQGHKLGLVVATGPVTKLLSITGVDGHLHLFDSVEAARSNV